MPETKIEELLAKLRRGLEHLYGERLTGVYLFGSHARAEATPESDVDILIVLDEVTDYGQEIEHTGLSLLRALPRLRRQYQPGFRLLFGLAASRQPVSRERPRAGKSRMKEGTRHLLW